MARQEALLRAHLRLGCQAPLDVQEWGRALEPTLRKLVVWCRPLGRRPSQFLRQEVTRVTQGAL